MVISDEGLLEYETVIKVWVHAKWLISQNYKEKHINILITKNHRILKFYVFCSLQSIFPINESFSDESVCISHTTFSSTYSNCLLGSNENKLQNHLLPDNLTIAKYQITLLWQITFSFVSKRSFLKWYFLGWWGTSIFGHSCIIQVCKL